MADQLEIIKRKIVPILKQYGAIKAGLFGSLVTGHLHRESDIDILVELPPELSLLDLVSLKLDLEEVLDREVDLVEYPLIHPHLKDKVLQQEVRVL